ncbi:DUF4832 domain-containing protein [Neolewinella persica]|uniref:DUF4832 domain-containing protein n=1 Tax=Neolewinella persica TaxID=70998 RepID=UPI00146F1A53|nr:DUF4832 domain-containing protein [Neolewinella persica]
MYLPFRVLLLLMVCTGTVQAQTTTVTYPVSTVDFPNPERGFYRYTETRSGNYDQLTESELADFRNPYTPNGAQYSIVSTLAFRYFFLEDFKAGPISAAYLNGVTADFAAARAAGVKIIPRFAYTDEVNGNGCPSFICPPYGDAPKNIVLDHIDQLAPILEANRDVIAAVQMGFIGTWGENYYTDFFGDASPEGNGQLFDADWQNRNEVLSALLSAVPEERMVQVRYPQAKQRYIYGLQAPTTAAPLTSAEAFSGTDKARLGFHNDCFLASAADFGTYVDYGNGTPGNPNPGAGGDTTNLKPYFARDSRYVVVGGETCSDGYNPQNNCAGTDPAAFGDEEMRRLHYSYLNSDYNNEVNNDWGTGGCMEAIKRSLGYRFELVSGTYGNNVEQGGELALDLQLENSGYAAPYNARNVELILRNTATGSVWVGTLDDDPRLWPREAGTISLTPGICVPAFMATGTYDLLLNLPDPMPSLHDNPDFSIRLGSLLPGGADGWEPATGYNDLGHQVTVVTAGGTPACGSGNFFVAENTSLPVDLMAFTATAEAKTVALRWEVREDAGHGYTVIERKELTTDFTETGHLPASGNTAITSSYLFADEDVTAGNTYYYRLRFVDLNGATKYSQTVVATLKNDGLSRVTITPNPSNGHLRLNFGTTEVPRGRVLVLDPLGRVVLRQRLTGILDLSTLSPGAYVVSVKVAEEVAVRRVVIR